MSEPQKCPHPLTGKGFGDINLMGRVKMSLIGILAGEPTHIPGPIPNSLNAAPAAVYISYPKPKTRDSIPY